MVIMSIALSSATKKSFCCISLVASSNSWARQHIAWKIKPLATMSTKFSASPPILNQSFPNTYNTSLLSAAFTRQGTSNWQIKHKSLHRSQIRSIQHEEGSNHSKMDTMLSDYFPKFSGNGNPREITNRRDYDSAGNDILYIDIAYGEDEMCIEKGGKIDIRYTVYNEEKNRVSGPKEAKVPSEEIPTGVHEGITGMRLKGRRIIIVPPKLADYQHVTKGKHAIYDVTILNIYSKNWPHRRL